MHLKAKTARRGGLALYLSQSFFSAGQPQSSVHLPAGCEPGLDFKLVIQRNRVAQQLSDPGLTAQLTDKASCMPGAAAGQLITLKQQHVLVAHLGEMIGGGAADNTAADHNGSGVPR